MLDKMLFESCIIELITAKTLRDQSKPYDEAANHVVLIKGLAKILRLAVGGLLASAGVSERVLLLTCKTQPAH